MPHETVNNLRFFYSEEGKGVPLVFLHGFSLDHRMWQPQQEYFSQHYRVICPDARGHGKSDTPLTGYSRAHRVQDLEELVDKLGLERFHLVGLSMGGATAIGHALAHPERLRSCTLISSGAAGYEVSMKFSRLDDVAQRQGVTVALEKWKNWTLSWYKEDRRDLRDLLDRIMSEYSGSIWRDPMRGQYPPEDDLSAVNRISVPTAIFAGRLDKVFAGLANLLHERIPASRLYVYPATGHMVNLEKPDQFNNDVAAFLAEVG